MVLPQDPSTDCSAAPQAWWTHDIGAIGNCDNKDPNYREMLVRWFQFGLTSPIFRQHLGNAKYKGGP